jgi:UDP-N-acetylglucosamine 3-dehydrogenase
MIKVGVIGLGNMGVHHARNYFNLENAQLICVCDLNKNLADDLSKKFNCKAYYDYKLMLEQENIDAVSIVVPTSKHKEVSLYCMEKGIDVLIEKPIAASVEDAMEMINKAKERGVILQVGHIERFNPAIKKLKEIVESGKLGEIISIIARRVGAVPVQVRDANVIIDLAVHDIDIINYLYGMYPNSVSGNMGKAIVERREDYAEIFLKYGKKSGFIQVNWITPVKIRNLTVTGSQGYAELNYITQELVVYQSNFTLQNVDEFGNHIQFGVPDKTIVGIEVQEPLKLELLSFIDCVKLRQRPLVDGNQGMLTLQIALGVIDSNKESL